MSSRISLVLQIVAGVAMSGGGVWCLCVKLPAERALQRRMVMAKGVIHDGLETSNVLKKISDTAHGTQVASLPMVAFTTVDGCEMLTEVGALRGSGSQRVVFTIGQQVGLKYDPVDPKIVWVDGQPSRAGFIGLLCAGLLITGLCLIWIGFRDLIPALQ